MPIFLLKLIGLWSTIKRLATAGFAWITASTTHLLFAALAIALLWGGYQRHNAGKWHRVADSAQTALKSALRASDANAAAQLAQNKAWEAKSTTLAKEADDAETELRASYGARNVAYADRMRADKVCRSSAAPAGQIDIAQSGNGPGSDAVMVSRADFDTLTGNTARLEAVHQWGEALVRDGLAVPAQ